MKTVGIIGGTGPESTVEYYRRIIAGYRQARPDGSFPSIIINSIDMQRLLNAIATSRHDEAADYLTAEIGRLAAAGADFAIVSANTPHLVFDELRRRASIPMLSIVEAACAEAKAKGLRRPALFGARFTMQAKFYPEMFSREGITVVAPRPEEQDFIHKIYMTELVSATFTAETRERLLTVLHRMQERDQIDSMILGGTELSLIFREESEHGIPLLDTTQIHVRAVVTELLA